MAKYIKHKFGHENKIFLQEEIKLIATLEQVHNSTTNSQILGKNGEKGLRDFLNRYLPNCFRAVSGHFVTPKGSLSPEMDLMLMDSRYPLVSENRDGSVVAMLHSVLATVEVKLSLDGLEIEKIRRNEKTITKLASEVFPSPNSLAGVTQYGFAYQSKITLKTVDKYFFKGHRPNDPSTDLFVMRAHKADQIKGDNILGAQLWLETSRYPSIATTRAALSDFYYTFLQNLYYSLEKRKYDFVDIGQQMNAYMSWGTFPNYEKSSGISVS